MSQETGFEFDYSLGDPEGACVLKLLINGKDDRAVAAFEGFFASRALGRREVGKTWLHAAATYGCVKACQWLVAHGADVNDTGINEEFRVRSFPLDDAVTRGSLPIVQLLLDHGALVDDPHDHYISPLMLAALYGQFEIAQVLIEHGAEINRQHGNWTRTALDIAEIYGHPDIAELLRAHGGIRLESDQRDWQGVAGQALIEAVEHYIGPVSPIALSQIVPGLDLEFSLLVAFVAPRKQQKLLFTAGLSDRLGTDLGICLAQDWPLNQSSLSDDRWNWPIRMLLKLLDGVLSGVDVGDGDVMTAEDANFAALCWPDGLERMMLVNPAVAGMPNLLLLAPLSERQKTETAAQRETLLAKLVQAKWAKLAVQRG